MFVMLFKYTLPFFPWGFHFTCFADPFWNFEVRVLMVCEILARSVRAVSIAQ